MKRKAPSAGVKLSSSGSRGLASDSQDSLLKCGGLLLGQRCVRNGWHWWEDGSSIGGGSWLIVSRWSWAWWGRSGSRQRSSGRVCGWIEVVLDVTGKVKR